MTLNRRRRSPSDDRELRLWRVGRALAVTFIVAVLAAGSVFYGLVYLLDFQEIDTTKKLDAKTLFDLVKLSFGVVAGAGALVALVVAYRRQRVDEAGAHREATRLHTERFSQAVEQLGSDSPAVRLGGVHALAGLADDAPDDGLRQTCIDVLCAYLQLPFTPDPGNDPAHQEEHHRYLALQKVRHTILRLIGDHYRRPRDTYRSWQGCDLDLTGVTIDGEMDFGGATFSDGRVSFSGATFPCGRVSFRWAKFTGGMVDFNGALFAGGEVSFDHATSSDLAVSFKHATFSSGKVSFVSATVSSDGGARFQHATFSGGTVDFHGAHFFGGEVDFYGAYFSGGEVSFEGAYFAPSGHRTYPAKVIFRRATFSGGRMSFDRDGVRPVVFSDCVLDFYGASFSAGEVSFRDADFSSSTVSFEHATFSGGTVTFERAAGPTPDGLLSAVGVPAVTGVTLPPAWLVSNP
ncbi:pentapeptide repeat-containing protein [Streptomyces thinghirensis]|uniref:Pentapeptide repeat-containing protein n=1 Tax=Streptomyces thinghirensis TaxID=551547 RepID=A0ABP9SZX6_9ACTN